MKELDFLEALLQEREERLEREPTGEMTFTLPTTTPIQEQITGVIIYRLGGLWGINSK
jgi:hypothetical protein